MTVNGLGNNQASLIDFMGKRSIDTGSQIYKSRRCIPTVLPPKSATFVSKHVLC